MQTMTPSPESRPSRHRAFVLLAVLALGCGFAESNALDLSRSEGVPVELKRVRMAESLAAELGPTSTKLSSTDGPNTVGLAYDVHVIEKAPDHAGVSARLACRVGDHTVVMPLAHDASNRLAQSAPGTKLEERTTFMPTPFSEGVPKVCEGELVYMISPPLAHVPEAGDPPTPRPQPQPLGTVCFANGKLAEGPCAAEVLPRTPAAAPVEASRLIGRIGPVQGGGHGVGITVMATAGEGVPEQFLLVADSTCEVAGETKHVPLGLVMSGTDLRPGESIVQSAATPSRDALATAPAWCTVRIQRSEQGTQTTLKEFCVRGEQTTEGACA